MRAGERPDFSQATQITMQTYQQIANSSAQRRPLARQIMAWKNCCQHFVEQRQVNPAWLTNQALPVLDAGYGPRRDALSFARRGFAVQAIDLSEEMLAQARLLCANEPEAERITIHQMDMRHLTLPDASCAGIWASASFLHIPKQENQAVLRALIRVLVPEGPLMLLVKRDDGGPDEGYDPSPENGSPRFFARYREDELQALLEQAGLRTLLLSSWEDAQHLLWLSILAQKP